MIQAKLRLARSHLFAKWNIRDCSLEARDSATAPDRGCAESQPQKLN